MFTDPTRVIPLLGITEGMKVADIGAGGGSFAIPLAKAVGGSGRVYAIEIQRGLLERIASAASAAGTRNIEVLWGDAEHPGGTKLRDGSVDLVLLANILFQTADRAACLRECARILRPGGKLAIIDWTDSFGGMGPKGTEVVSERQALALAEAAGFKKVSTFNPGSHHYGILLTHER